MTSEVDDAPWRARYPDLVGKVAVVCGTSSVLADAARALCDNGVLVGLLVPDRDVADSATRYADQLGVMSLGIVGDPTDRTTWERVAPHFEQRLGPIDIAVLIAPPADRAFMATVLMPDMAARRRGVIVEAGAEVEPLAVPTGLRHRSISAGAGARSADIAAAIVLCASDVLNATTVDIRLGSS